MVKNNLHTMAGVIDPDYTGTITVILHNFGDTPQTLSRGDKIAQMIMENAGTPIILEVNNLTPTLRGENSFGSTDERNDRPDEEETLFPPVSLPPPDNPESPHPREPPKNVTPVISTLEKEAITKDIHLTFTPPYNISFSSSPLNNQTFRTVATFGTDECLGFDLRTCPHFGLPQVNNLQKFYSMH